MTACLVKKLNHGFHHGLYRSVGVVLLLLVWTIQLLLTQGDSVAYALEYGFINDFHFSSREELNEDRTFQFDNYVNLDLYSRVKGLNFYSGFRITNDLNLLDKEAAQLTFAYLTYQRMSGDLVINAGRKFVTQGFDAYIGDGLSAVYQHDGYKVSLHYTRPFNAESEAVENESVDIYGIRLDSERKGTAGVLRPYAVSLLLEQRDYLEQAVQNQTLVGCKGSTSFNWPIESDVYARTEYESKEGIFRRATAGWQMYFNPAWAGLVEVDRYEPIVEALNAESEAFLMDNIIRAFTDSAILGGKAGITYTLPRNQELTFTYIEQRYRRNQGDIVYGNGLECFLSFFPIASSATNIGIGYSGRITGSNAIHLGVFRARTPAWKQSSLHFRAESGVLSNERWNDAFVMHLRGGVSYQPRPNLKIQLDLEENRNPYFDSDFRVMSFVRYFWGKRERK